MDFNSALNHSVWLAYMAVFAGGLFDDVNTVRLSAHPDYCKPFRRSESRGEVGIGATLRSVCLWHRRYVYGAWPYSRIYRKSFRQRYGEPWCWICWNLSRLLRARARMRRPPHYPTLAPTTRQDSLPARSFVIIYLRTTTFRNHNRLW
jgi:hypothetical protein